MTGIKFELPRRLAPFLHHPFFRSANSVRSVAKSDSPIRITYKYLLTITLICATLQYDSPPHTFPAHFPPCNPCRISSLRTPVFHRPATTRFQATSTLFKKHGGIPLKSEPQAKPCDARIPKWDRSTHSAYQRPPRGYTQFPSITIIPLQLRPNPSPCTVCSFTFSAPGGSALGSARPSDRDDRR